jgi:hypothetical protein
MKMDKMTDEQIRVEIAKALGWRVLRKTGKRELAWLVSGKGEYRTRGLFPSGETDDEIMALVFQNKDYFSALPNWPTDIGAAWALEESIPEGERGKYAQKLVDVIFQGAVEVYNSAIEVNVHLDVDGEGVVYALAHATPRQRCEAYLAWKGVEG